MSQTKDEKEPGALVLSKESAATMDLDSIVPGGAQGGVVAGARRKDKVKALAVIRSRGRIRSLFQAIGTDEDEVA